MDEQRNSCIAQRGREKILRKKMGRLKMKTKSVEMLSRAFSFQKMQI